MMWRIGGVIIGKNLLKTTLNFARLRRKSEQNFGNLWENFNPLHISIL